MELFFTKEGEHDDEANFVNVVKLSEIVYTMIMQKSQHTEIVIKGSLVIDVMVTGFEENLVFMLTPDQTVQQQVDSELVLESFSFP